MRVDTEELMRRATDKRFRIVTVSSRELKALLKERERLRNALENLEMQGLRDVVSGWVCVPEVEWDANMMPNDQVQP